MEKLKFNPNNKKYYSEEFIKGFECGVERQFNADMTDKTAECHEAYKAHEMFEDRLHCDCGCELTITRQWDLYNFCPTCGSKMKGVD